MSGRPSSSAFAGSAETKVKAGLLIAFVLGVSAALLALRTPELREASFWRRQASPGALSTSHAELEDDCSDCHTSISGVEPAKCIVCHANETALLQRQATAFHSSVGACATCHGEHRGRHPSPILMDHDALAGIGLSILAGAEPGSENRELYRHLFHVLPGPGIRGRAPDSLLDCRTCHASKDRHWGLFGKDCAECHATKEWGIARFRHPPPSSLDCAQCHQAPPSHYMEHFRMISMKVAGQEHGRVEQCYLCHQTTAWNDIRSVGLVKHH